MTFDIIRFRLDTPLHLSNARPNDYGSSERVVHSDTLTAAIYQAWAMLGQSDWIPTAAGQSPGFAVSSLFPFRGGSQPIYFLPKPYFQNKAGQRDSDAGEPGDAKKYKQVQYVDLPHFESYLHQLTPPTAGTAAIRGAFQSADLATDKGDFLTTDVLPRLVKPRDESEPTPFYMERLYFSQQSGLWCMVQYEDDAARKRVKSAVLYLADNGIGTDRAVGNGQFTPAFDTLAINAPPSARYAVSLSLFCPQNHNQLTRVLTDAETRYDLIRRGGWLSEPHNSYRKRSVWMFREGSLLRHDTTGVDTIGSMIDLRPDDDKLPTKIGHPVWRDGRTLLLPVNY